MDPIEKFIRDNFTPIVTENKLGMSCLFKHKRGLIDDNGLIDHRCDGVIYFERPKKGWSKKPIVSNQQFIITDGDTYDLIDFLSKYYNLDESNYMEVKRIITLISTETIQSHFKDSI
jgi:hypothetical protein